MSPRYWAWLEVGEVMESSLLFSTGAALVLNLPFLRGFAWDGCVLRKEHVLCLNHLCCSGQRAPVKSLWLLWLAVGTGEPCSFSSSEEGLHSALSCILAFYSMVFVIVK